MDNETFFSDLIYRAYMSDAINGQECKEACSRLSINWPPKLISKGNQATYQAPVFKTSEVNHGLHSN